MFDALAEPSQEAMGALDEKFSHVSPAMRFMVKAIAEECWGTMIAAERKAYKESVQ